MGGRRHNLTRNVVEYAFSDVRRKSITRDQKILLKENLLKERNEELGRKLKRQINNILKSYPLDDREAFADYLNRRKAYDNAVITMILLLSDPYPNAVLMKISTRSGPFTAKQIEEVLDRPKIADVNRRLLDFVKGHNDNMVLELPSGSRVHVTKERRSNTRSIYWGAEVINKSKWNEYNVVCINVSYPRNYDVKKFILSNNDIRNSMDNYGPRIFQSEGTSDFIDVYFMHEKHISHSRYLVDGGGAAIIFERRPLRDDSKP